MHLFGHLTKKQVIRDLHYPCHRRTWHWSELEARGQVRGSKAKIPTTAGKSSLNDRELLLFSWCWMRLCRHQPQLASDHIHNPLYVNWLLLRAQFVQSRSLILCLERANGGQSTWKAGFQPRLLILAQICVSTKRNPTQPKYIQKQNKIEKHTYH